MAQDGTSGKSGKSRLLDLIWSSPFLLLPPPIELAAELTG
jgi:hypothetical protein